MNNKIIIFLVVICVAIAGIMYFSNRDVITDNNPATPENITYTNETHGYLLTYSETLDVREYNNENVVFGDIDQDMVLGVVEARVVFIEGKPGQTFIDAVIESMKTACAADGPDSTFSCVEANQLQPFTSSSGLYGYTFYLHGELTNLTTNETTSVGRGPFFTFPLKSTATQTSALVIHPPMNQTAQEADSATVRSIAESIETI